MIAIYDVRSGRVELYGESSGPSFPAFVFDGRSTAVSLLARPPSTDEYEVYPNVNDALRNVKYPSLIVEYEDDKFNREVRVYAIVIYKVRYVSYRIYEVVEMTHEPKFVDNVKTLYFRRLKITGDYKMYILERYALIRAINNVKVRFLDDEEERKERTLDDGKTYLLE